MPRGLRWSALQERLDSSLWFLPAVSVVASIVASLLLSRVGLGQPAEAVSLGFGGTPEGARAVLSTIAGSTITVTSLTFTLTVVALQVASTQFSPRILRNFLADRGNQMVLSTFLATFSFSLVALRSIRGGSEEIPAFVPDWAVGGTLVLTALSVAMLVFFFHHLTQQLRVESVLEELRDDTLALVRRHLAPRDPGGAETELPHLPEGAVTLACRSSGYLQALEVQQLQRLAQARGIVVRLRPRVGGPCTRGSTLAWAWPVEPGSTIPADAVEALTADVNRAVLIGFERTMQQDVSFGIRQLVDIAVRALSPGINDPATAIAVIGSVGVLLAELTSRQTGHEVVRDDQERIRVAIDTPTFGEYLGLACDQPRRYGAGEPAVLVALLEMLADVAELAEIGHDALSTQITATIETARNAGWTPHELERVVAKGRDARATLRSGRRAADPTDVDEPAG